MADEPTPGANIEPAPSTGPAISPIADGFSTAASAPVPVSDVDIVKGARTATAARSKAEPAKVVPPVEGKAEPAKAEPAKEEPPKDAGKKKDDDSRYDQIPRFKELIEEVQFLKGQISTLTKQPAPEPAQRPLPYKDVTLMSDEELREWQTDDPKGYAANLYQQIYHETRETLKSEQEEHQQTRSIKETYDVYAKSHPDFPSKWNSGDIQRFIRSHPGHNAISAHMMLSEADREAQIQARIDEAVAKATKEAEGKVVKNFQAKRTATLVNEAGSPTAVEGAPDELKHPDKYGGVTAALARRLERLRQVAL